MITPVAHGSDPATTDIYKVEPYVVVADIYGSEPHVGRGGWTWYTGSAGWLYRVALESVLGVTLHEGRELRLKPCIPDDWPRFRVRYRLSDRKTVYDIEVVNPDRHSETVRSVVMDGIAGAVEHGAARIPLAADGATHRVTVTLG
jgi:cyclic beta-1,2-glucan synthetase